MSYNIIFQFMEQESSIKHDILVYDLGLLKNKLPTKDDLLRWGVMDNNSQDCVGGCGGVKTLQHLFFFFLP